MNIVFINSSDTFEKRIDLIYEVLKKQSHNIKVITSDYMHIEKKKRKCNKEDYILLPTIMYKRNISLQRLYSHYKFAKDAYQYIKDWDIDLLYIVVPPNSQAVIAKKYKKTNSKVKVVIDIIDLWPESLPIKGTNNFPFSLWANVRNRHLKYADKVITECDLYQDRLGKYFKNKSVKTIYWSKKNQEVDIKPQLNNEELHLCYLGSINNITDIQGIQTMIRELNSIKPVVVKIIGDGEKKEEMVRLLIQEDIQVIDFGKIYDANKKQEIFNTCHYGINFMKDTVCIGLTMKSIDYLSGGLPIINNVKGDTEKLVEERNIGINWERKDSDRVLYYDLSSRQRAIEVYNQYFEENNFKNEILSYLS